MTKQEIYDKVCAGLAAQGGPSMDEKGAQCRYRGTSGRKCAAGFLIPDELYKDGMDQGIFGGGGTFKSLCASDPEVLALVGEENVNLVQMLQGVHDANASRTVPPRDEFASVAARFDITPGAEQAITRWSLEPTKEELVGQG